MILFHCSLIGFHPLYFRHKPRSSPRIKSKKEEKGEELYQYHKILQILNKSSTLLFSTQNYSAFETQSSVENVVKLCGIAVKTIELSGKGKDDNYVALCLRNDTST